MLKGNKVYLRFIDSGDERELLSLNLRNRDFFGKYSATRDDAFFTLEHHVRLIDKYREDRYEDARYAFGIFRQDSDELVGVITLSDIIRGPIQSCFVGYSMDQDHNGKGFMTEAVELVVAYGFRALNLHRIEAGVMPSNAGSQRVLEKCGFEREGLWRKNVRINGKWEDHYAYGIINPNDLD